MNKYSLTKKNKKIIISLMNQMLNELDDFEKENLLDENDLNLEENLTRAKSSFKEYSSKVDWFIFTLICLFTLGLIFQLNYNILN